MDKEHHTPLHLLVRMLGREYTGLYCRGMLKESLTELLEIAGADYVEVGTDDWRNFSWLPDNKFAPNTFKTIIDGEIVVGHVFTRPGHYVPKEEE